VRPNVGNDNCVANTCNQARIDNGGVCQQENIGNPIGCCFEAVANTPAVAGRRMDYAVFEIDPAVRYKHKCAQRGSGSPAAIIPVIGTVAPGVVGESDIGAAVQKYGRRTHFTQGKIFHVYTAANGAPTLDMRPSGHRYKIFATAAPAFADGNPQTAGGITTPQNEAGWYNSNVRDPVVARIQTMTNPATHVVYTGVEALAAFTALQAGGAIGDAFSSAGDSGSWIYRADGKVLGLLSSGGWEADFGTMVQINFGGQNQNWPSFRKSTFAFGIDEVVAKANTDLAGPTLSVCVEANRPMPTTQNPCTYVSNNECTFPHACVGSVHKGIAGCLNRDFS